jgi:hypothetical protein
VSGEAELGRGGFSASEAVCFLGYGPNVASHFFTRRTYGVHSLHPLSEKSRPRASHKGETMMSLPYLKSGIRRLRKVPLRRALVLFLIFLVLFGTMLPNPAWAEGRWRGGHGGGHHGGWWLPGAILGGLALGAVAVVTAPFVALSTVVAGPPVAYPPPPVAYGPPVVYTPPPVYAAPSPVYQQAPSYATQVTAVQREVAYPNGKYVLYGDGVREPWQWVWVPSASPPPPPPPPRQ